MRRFLLPVCLGAGALGLLAAWANPSPFRRVDVVREVDGERATWVIWFGRWPVHRVERIPGLRVTDDFRAAVRNSGVRLPADLERTTDRAIRFRYADRTEYRLSPIAPRLTNDEAVFFQAQLSRAKARRSGSGVRVEGVCPDGRTRLWHQAYDWSGSRREVLGLIVPRGETRLVASP